MQVVKTPGYIAFALNINGPLLYIQASDSGGELDPHGADARGNPGETQAQEWFVNLSASLADACRHEFLSGFGCAMRSFADPRRHSNLHEGLQSLSGHGLAPEPLRQHLRYRAPTCRLIILLTLAGRLQRRASLSSLESADSRRTSRLSESPTLR